MRIRHTLPLLFLVAGGLAFAQVKGDDPAAELKKFEGSWVMVSGKSDGKPVPSEQVAKNRIVWNSGDVVLDSPHQAKDPIKAKVTIVAASGATRAMNWTRANGPDAGKTMLAIYEFRGADEYVVVFAPAGKDRPRDFSAATGSGHFHHVWKRVMG